MNFTTKKIQTQTLGEYLRQCRDHLGLSLEQVGKLTQIQPKFLQALEEGGYKILPAPVYVKGFLKTLAKLYQADYARLSLQFQEEQQLAGALQKVDAVSVRQKAFSFPRFILSPKTLIAALAGLLILASLGYLYFQVSSLNRPPHLTVSSPVSDGTVDSSLAVVTGQTEPGASVYLNNQPIVTDAKGAFQENLSLSPGSNQLIIKSVNKFGQETVLARSLMYQPKQIAGSFVAATSTAAQRLGVSLEVIIGAAPTWVQIIADGEQKYADTMPANSRQQVTAAGKISLTTNNAGETRAIVNGKDLGILGKEGEQLRNIEFTSAP